MIKKIPFSSDITLHKLEVLFDFSFSNYQNLKVFSQGFQSWSESRELKNGEVIYPVRIIKSLDIFNKRSDIGFSNKKNVISHDFIYFRLEDTYLGMAIPNPASIPVAFCYSWKNKTIKLVSHNNPFNNPVDKNRKSAHIPKEIFCFYAENYFELQDVFREIYLPFQVMSEADSLMSAEGEDKGLILGWESWYQYYTKIDNKIILDNLNSISSSHSLISLMNNKKNQSVVFQIDDGWQKIVGDWDIDSIKFPTGLDPIAEGIKNKGLVPGIWWAPFVVRKKCSVYSLHKDWILKDNKGKNITAGYMPEWGGKFYVLDLSHPEVQKYLLDIFQRFISWGFRYFKLDFLFTGIIPGAYYSGGDAVFWYRNIIKMFRSIKISEPLYFLGCGAPIAQSIDLFPIMRIGADTREQWEDKFLQFVRYQSRPSAGHSLKYTMERFFLDRTLYLNDPDVSFFRYGKDILLTTQEKQLVSIINFLFGSQMMISDNLSASPTGEQNELIEWFLEKVELIKHMKMGVQQVEKGIYKLIEKSGRAWGLVNLMDKEWSIPVEMSHKQESFRTTVIDHSKSVNILSAHGIILKINNGPV